MPNNARFDRLLQEWISLNSRLIWNKALPKEIRFQLFQSRKEYLGLFKAMEVRS